jgi:pyridinium-3,5-biscarboxylic acid mononucleotide synthase
MTESDLRTLLALVKQGTIPQDEAFAQILAALREAPYENLDFARIDHHRAMRLGMPEVVFGQGKTPSQIALIAERIVSRGHSLLVTRADAAAWAAVREVLPGATFHESARVIFLHKDDTTRGTERVLVVSAGTADLPVADEAAVCAEVMGHPVERLYDVGVAGLHRLLDSRTRLEAAAVVIVVAGMEGALPSVVGGLVSVPVIAVPTSVGYGASLGGIAALLGMLNSCATGLAVVNIDNGFGAAALANRILRTRAANSGNQR